jgi:hypothetical protein
MPTNGNVLGTWSLVHNGRDAITNVSILFITTTRTLEKQGAIGRKDFNNMCSYERNGKILDEFVIVPRIG